VSVSATCDAAKRATRGALTQDRFSIEKVPANAPAERWKIPVCVKTPGADPARCVVVDKPEQTVELARGCPPWVFMNAGARGYYRTAYPPDMLRALGPQVETALTAPERIALMGDEWALVRSGQHTAGDFLALASHFDRESSAGALETVTGHLATVREYLTTDATRPKLEAYVRRLLNPILKEVGFSAAASDTDARRELRGAVVDALGTTGNDPTVVSESRAALDRALSGGPPLDPTLATPIVRVSARHGNAALFDALAAAAARAGSPDEHYRYLFALASFTDPALEDRALNLALTPDLRNQDTALYLSRFLANPEVNARAWAFVKAHWAALAPKVAIFGGDTAVVGALGSFCDAASRDDVKAFFAAHPLPAAARGLRQTIERIDDCIALKERQRPIVAEFLAKE
jgi:aminopeptidase N